MNWIELDLTELHAMYNFSFFFFFFLGFRVVIDDDGNQMTCWSSVALITFSLQHVAQTVQIRQLLTCHCYFSLFITFLVTINLNFQDMLPHDVTQRVLYSRWPLLSILPDYFSSQFTISSRHPLQKPNSIQSSTASNLSFIVFETAV